MAWLEWITAPGVVPADEVSGTGWYFGVGLVDSVVSGLMS